jgi:recombination protein RecT
MIASEGYRKQFEMVLPSHLTAERFTRIALTCLNKTPKLAECTQASVMQCLLNLSQMGLEPDGRNAHLIPYGKECTLVVDYKGYAELVMRSGLVASIHADKVCENDVFVVDLGEIKEHRIDYRADRGKPYAYYCRVLMKDGTTKCEVMTRAEVEAIRGRSRAGNSGPWVSDFDEMAKKTVFRRAQKWLPISPEIRDALEKDDDRIIEHAPAPAAKTQIEVLNNLIGVTHEPAAEPVTTVEPQPSRYASYLPFISTATTDDLPGLNNDIQTDETLTPKEKTDLGVELRARADALKKAK